MQALDTVKAELAPRLDRLVEYLATTDEGRAAAFFSRIGSAVAEVADEGDLLEIFFALSTTAFQGFAFDPVAAAKVDELLAYAEQVSHTFMASEGVSH